MSQNHPGIRVGYVVPAFPALYETSLLNQLLALEARGMFLHIFALEPSRDPRFHEDLPELKASVTYLPGPFSWRTLFPYNRHVPRRRRWKHFWTLTRALFAGKPEFLFRFFQSGYVAHIAEGMEIGHLHAHEAGRAATVAQLVSRMTGIPHSLSIDSRSAYRKRINRRVLTRRIKAARFVTVPCDSLEKRLNEISPVSETRIHKVYPGVNLERFVPTPAAPTAPFRFVCVAGLEEHKGLPILLKACRRLRDRKVEFQVDVVGTGPLWNHLRNIIRGSDLQSHVHLHGHKSHHEVAASYQRAHAFVLPSVVANDGCRDGLPVAVVEALASGLPVIASRLGGLPEVIKQGGNGLLVDPEDPEALADAMESLVTDLQLRQRLGAAARKSVAARFGRDRIAAGLQHILDESLSAAPEAGGLGAWLQSLSRKVLDRTTGGALPIPSRLRSWGRSRDKAA